MIKRFSNIRGRDKSNQVPEFMRNTQVWDRLPDSQVKNVRRSLERTRQVMENVKQGTFPTKK